MVRRRRDLIAPPLVERPGPGKTVRMPTNPQQPHGATPFHDLDAFLAIPRIGGLALSPDGSRLVTTVSELSSDRTRSISALWELDPEGERPARRLTRSDKGESAPAFRADGALLFLSGRAQPDAPKGEPEVKTATLWALPADGGEAERILHPAAGVDSFATARSGGRIAYLSPRLPGAVDAESDAALRKARDEAKVSAVLHEDAIVRYWDHDLGPGRPHVITASDTAPAEAPVDCGSSNAFEPAVVISPDGSLVAWTALSGGHPDTTTEVIVVSDAVTGKELRRIHVDGVSFTSALFTPDSRGLVCLRSLNSSWEKSHEATLWYFTDATDPLDAGRDLLPDFPHWPGNVAVSPVPGRDGAPVVFFTADTEGRSPIYRLDTADTGNSGNTATRNGTGNGNRSGTPTRLTLSGAYTNLTVSPDGTTLYALRAAVDSPPTPVRLDARRADQDDPAVLPAPGRIASVPGSLTEVTTTAEDGTPLRAWLVLPEGASAERPAPLLLWVHGGPQMSWNSWTWRWNPWVAAAAGYAVLLPDPALSTGYGQEMHARGWGDWGGNPFTDVLALTDAALERDDLDAERTAMMGGSFGGYMANWIAGHTDRFKAIVTHAALWNLYSFNGTTDATAWWRRHFGDPLTRPERLDSSSPHFHAASIRTPMLVVHGDKDYRVPIGEALALWSDLVRFEVPAKFLYFPDEGHWVLKPNNAKLWYTTVLAFLAHHVLGEEWRRPDHV
ncbi:dipeptidyl aminopeptidase/acylaminoacyl peptidase [Streptacidiphilus sp. MAP5-52]